MAHSCKAPRSRLDRGKTRPVRKIHSTARREWKLTVGEHGWAVWMDPFHAKLCFPRPKRRSLMDFTVTFSRRKESGNRWKGRQQKRGETTGRDGNSAGDPSNKSSRAGGWRKTARAAPTSRRRRPRTDQGCTTYPRGNVSRQLLTSDTSV